MKDFLGKEIREGDVIALPKSSSRGTYLVRRFVKEVHETHLVVQPDPEEQKDKRRLGRVQNTRSCIVITQKENTT